METDDDHATISESFSLVQNILFIEHTDRVSAHQQVNSICLFQLGWVFVNDLLGGTLGDLLTPNGTIYEVFHYFSVLLP